MHQWLFLSHLDQYGSGHLLLIWLAPQQYVCPAGQGHMYSARFSASSSFTNVRLPFNAFRPERGAPLQFDPADACHISIRRNARPPDTVLGSYGNGQVETNSQAAGKFHLEVLRIKV